MATPPLSLHATMTRGRDEEEEEEEDDDWGSVFSLEEVEWEEGAGDVGDVGDVGAMLSPNDSSTTSSLAPRKSRKMRSSTDCAYSKCRRNESDVASEGAHRRSRMRFASSTAALARSYESSPALRLRLDAGWDAESRMGGLRLTDTTMSPERTPRLNDRFVLTILTASSANLPSWARERGLPQKWTLTAFDSLEEEVERMDACSQMEACCFCKSSMLFLFFPNRRACRRVCVANPRYALELVAMARRLGKTRLSFLLGKRIVLFFSLFSPPTHTLKKVGAN